MLKKITGTLIILFSFISLYAQEGVSIKPYNKLPSCDLGVINIKKAELFYLQDKDADIYYMDNKMANTNLSSLKYYIDCEFADNYLQYTIYDSKDKIVLVQTGRCKNDTSFKSIYTKDTSIFEKNTVGGTFKITFDFLLRKIVLSNYKLNQSGFIANYSM
jgi:hypothetical protein